MATMLLPILPGTLPPNVCYANEQARLVAFAENMSAQLAAGMAFYNYGDEAPSVENQGYPWLRTQDMRWYRFEGSWITPYNYDANERRLYIGSLVDLQTYDGGDTNAPGTSSGPTWVEDTDFIGRSPMHPGAIPSSDPPVVLSVSTDTGAGSFVQTVAQMPEHSHSVKYDTSDSGSGYPTVSNGATNVLNYNTEPAGESDPISLVHPVRGIYIIKWSGRLYRKV